MAKHFLKTLILFLGMIILGLAGVFLVSYLDKDDVDSADLVNAKIEVAE